VKIEEEKEKFGIGVGCKERVQVWKPGWTRNTMLLWELEA
jgi:hypothetical protein